MTSVPNKLKDAPRTKKLALLTRNEPAPGRRRETNRKPAGPNAIEKRPAAKPIVRIGVLIHDVARMRKTIFDQAVRNLGITRAQWWALSNLSRHKDDGMSQSDLARKLDVGKPTIGGLIDRLTERGLVERRLDGDDRRVRKLFITARGYEIISNMSPIASSLNDVFLENIPQDQVHIAELALEQMKKNLQKLLGSGSTLNLPEE